MSEQKLDGEWRTKWLEALRSGRYAQTTTQLRSDDGVGYCCLGVACDVFDPDKWHLASGAGNVDGWGWDGSYGDLPVWMCASIGLHRDAESDLITMNDNGKSFDEIADWIEANL